MTSMPSPPASLIALVNAPACTIPEAFDARTQATPEQLFLRAGGRSWTYAQARERALSFAGYLRTVEAGPRPRVVAFVGNHVETMWAWLGTAYAGGVLVTINPKHRGALLRDMLVRARASVLITEAALLPELQALEPPGVQTVLLADAVPDDAHLWGSAVSPFAAAQGEPPTDRPRIRPGDPACILYTSGTTGRSKAVVVSHNQYCRGAARLVDSFGLQPTDVFHNWLPLCHLAGQLHMTITAIICGGTVALFPTFSTSRFWDDVRTNGCSVLCGFASILHFIWSLPQQPDDAQSPLRVGIFAGIPVDLHAAFEQRFRMTLAENYGMTEVDPITYPRLDRPTPPGSCGLPSDDFELAILDDEDQQLPPGVMGEIAIRPRVADVLTVGYEGDSAATLGAFRNLWFHTGDLGHVDADGFLYFRGRKSHYIRRRGENVSAAELEAILLGHPDIDECVAVGVPSPVGEEEIKVVVVPRTGVALAAPVVHAFATRQMASFMVPRYIEIADSLPRTELGKVKLPEVRQLTAQTWDARGGERP